MWIKEGSDRADGRTRTCSFCGSSKRLWMKTCGKRECITKSHAITIKQPKKALKKTPNRVCAQCGDGYYACPRTKQIYCSYQCFLDSGGTFRAGLAAAKAMRQYGAKKDANHRELLARFRELDIPIYDLSACGHGVPDTIAWISEGWHFVEFKNPKTGYGRRGLNKIQRRWIESWKGGPVYIVRSLAEVDLLCAGKFSEVECHRVKQ